MYFVELNMVSRQNYSKNRRNSQINKTPIRMVILQTIASSNFLHFSMFLKLFSCLFEMRAGRKYRVSRFDQQFLGHNRLFYCRKAFLSNFQQWILQRPRKSSQAAYNLVLHKWIQIISEGVFLIFIHLHIHKDGRCHKGKTNTNGNTMVSTE